MTTTTDTVAEQRAELETLYVEALADETPGSYGRVRQIASDPAIRDRIVSVRMDRDAVEGVRVLLRKDHVSTARLRELRKLQDNAEKNLAHTQAALAEAQNVTDAAKSKHDQLRGQVYQCERGIENVKYQAQMHPLAFRAVAAEVKAAGIST